MPAFAPRRWGWVIRVIDLVARLLPAPPTQSSAFTALALDIHRCDVLDVQRTVYPGGHRKVVILARGPTAGAVIRVELVGGEMDTFLAWWETTGEQAR